MILQEDEASEQDIDVILQGLNGKHDTGLVISGELGQR
jgi:hypothetical protein